MKKLRFYFDIIQIKIPLALYAVASLILIFGAAFVPSFYHVGFLGEKMQSNYFILGFLVLPMLCAYNIILAFSTDFSKKTFSFVLSLPLNLHLTYFIRFIRLFVSNGIIFVAVIASGWNNIQEAYKITEISIWQMLFYTITVYVFLSAVSYCLVLLTKSHFISTLIIFIYAMADIFLIAAMFPKASMFFYNLLPVTDKFALKNRGLYLLISAIIIAATFAYTASSMFRKENNSEES